MQDSLEQREVIPKEPEPEPEPEPARPVRQYKVPQWRIDSHCSTFQAAEQAAERRQQALRQESSRIMAAEFQKIKEQKARERAAKQSLHQQSVEQAEEARRATEVCWKRQLKAAANRLAAGEQETRMFAQQLAARKAELAHTSVAAAAAHAGVGYAPLSAQQSLASVGVVDPELCELQRLYSNASREHEDARLRYESLRYRQEQGLPDPAAAGPGPFLKPRAKRKDKDADVSAAVHVPAGTPALVRASILAEQSSPFADGRQRGSSSSSSSSSSRDCKGRRSSSPNENDDVPGWLETGRPPSPMYSKLPFAKSPREREDRQQLRSASGSGLSGSGGSKRLSQKASGSTEHVEEETAAATPSNADDDALPSEAQQDEAQGNQGPVEALAAVPTVVGDDDKNGWESSSALPTPLPPPVPTAVMQRAVPAPLVIPGPGPGDVTYVNNLRTPAPAPASRNGYNNRRSIAASPFSPQPPPPSSSSPRVARLQQWTSTAGLRVAPGGSGMSAGNSHQVQRRPATVPARIGQSAGSAGDTGWNFASGGGVRHSAGRLAGSGDGGGGEVARASAPQSARGHREDTKQRQREQDTLRTGVRNRSARQHRSSGGMQSSARLSRVGSATSRSGHGALDPHGSADYLYTPRGQQWPPVTKAVRGAPLPKGLVSHRWCGVNPGETEAAAWVHRALQPNSPVALRSSCHTLPAAG